MVNELIDKEKLEKRFLFAFEMTEIHNYRQIVALYGTWIAGACIQLIVSSLLLVSIFHRHPKTGIPWLVFFGLSLVAKSVALIACIVLGLVLYAVLLPIAIGNLCVTLFENHFLL